MNPDPVMLCCGVPILAFLFISSLFVITGKKIRIGKPIVSKPYSEMTLAEQAAFDYANDPANIAIWDVEMDVAGKVQEEIRRNPWGNGF